MQRQCAGERPALLSVYKSGRGGAKRTQWLTVFALMAAFMGIEQGNAAAQRGANALPPSKAPTDNNGEKAARCFVVSRSDGAGASDSAADKSSKPRLGVALAVRSKVHQCVRRQRKT
jgi:hypothetical protein